MKKIIFTIDLDSFFASCEEARNPEYKGMPLAVVTGHGDKRGVVGACNYPARDKGIHAGMPLFKANRLCPKLVKIETDFEYYVEKGEEVFQIIDKYTNKLEVGSIDEVFIDVADKTDRENAVSYAKKIYFEVLEKTGLTISIGISDNKIISKVASGLDKPSGITEIYTDQLDERYWYLDIKKIPYVGNATNIVFKGHGINTIGDLAKLDTNSDKYFEIKKQLGIKLDGFIEVAKGTNPSVIDDGYHKVKSLSISQTFPKNLLGADRVKSEMLEITKKVVSKMKYRNLIGRTVYFSTKDEGPWSYKNMSISLDEPTNDISLIFGNVMKLFDQWWDDKTEDEGVRFISIGVSNLYDAFHSAEQITFETLEEAEKISRERTKEENIVKDLNHILGFEALRTGWQQAYIKRFVDKSINGGDKAKFKRWNEDYN